MGKGKITRKDLIEEKVFQIGPEYAKSVDVAIEANKKWKASFADVKQSAIDFNSLEQQYKINPDRAKFLKIKQEEEKLRIQAQKAVNAEQDALQSLEKTEQQIINTQKKKLQLANSTAAAARKSTKLTASERLERQRLNKIEKEAAILASKTSTLIDKLNVKRSRAARIVQDLVAKQQLGSDLSRKEQQQLARSSQAFDKYNRAIRQAKETTQQFQENVGNYPKQFTVATASLKRFIGAFGLTSGIFLFAGAVRNAVNVFLDFDQGQADLAAILGKSRKEMSALTEHAKELGATTAFTATQVSALQLELSKLGFVEDDILKATVGVENLAIATGVDAARAAKLAGASLRGFGLEASEANRVAAALAVSTTKSASTFESLETAMPKVSAIAKSFGFTLEDTTALLGSLSNAGFEASVSGTSLRQIFLQLADSNGKLSKRLGGSAKTLDELVVQFKKLDAEGIDLAEAFDLTNARSVAAFKVFLQGADDIKVLRDSIIDVEDELDALAAEKLNSVRGELTLLNSAWEGWILSLDSSDAAATSIKDTIALLTANLSKILDTAIKLGKAFLIWKAILISINVVNRLYTAGIILMRTAKIALAGGIGKATIAMKSFNTATKSNPIGLLLSVLAAGIATWYAFSDGINETSEAMAEMNRRAQESIDLSNERIQANIDGINRQLALIDATVDEEEVANKKKIDLLTEEIKAREDAFDKQRDAIELTKDNSNKEIEANSKRVTSEISSNKQILESRKSLSETLSTYSTGGASSSSSSGGKGGDKKQIQPVSVAVIEGQIEADKLKEIRRQLILQLGKITRAGSRKERDDARKNAFNLRKFILKDNISFLKEFEDDNTRSFEGRQEANKQRIRLEVELAEETARFKFEASKRFSQQEIDNIIKTGEISIEQKKKINDQELLVIAELNSKKRQIAKEGEESGQDLGIEKLKSDAKVKLAIQNKLLSEELDRENENFQATKFLYDTEADAIEAHEKRMFGIKKTYAIRSLNIQVAQIKSLLQAEELSAVQRAEYEKKLAAIKLNISKVTTGEFISNNEKIVLSDKEKTDLILETASQLAGALTDLANSLFERKIQQIDQELEANQLKYERLLQNENLSDEQRKILELKREKERAKLEAKKRKEQEKQAKLNKALALTQAAINTALAITSALTTAPAPLGIALAIIAGTLGAIQIAAIAAQPIPKYALGTEDHPGGMAEVGERRPEVITEPGKKPYVVKRRSTLNLPKHTKVTPSLKEYKEMMADQAGGVVTKNTQQLMTFQNSVNYSNDKELINEMKLTRKAIQRNKPLKQERSKNIDIPHELFRANNINWDN